MIFKKCTLFVLICATMQTTVSAAQRRRPNDQNYQDIQALNIKNEIMRVQLKIATELTKTIVEERVTTIQTAFTIGYGSIDPIIALEGPLPEKIEIKRRIEIKKEIEDFIIANAFSPESPHCIKNNLYATVQTNLRGLMDSYILKITPEELIEETTSKIVVKLMELIMKQISNIRSIL